MSMQRLLGAAPPPVIELDRKWSDYDMGWAEADPDELAARVTSRIAAARAFADASPYPSAADLASGVYA